MPTEKSKEIDDLLTSITGISRQSVAVAQICTMCKKDASHFRDELSRKEYNISGLCQQCQDEVFGV